MQFLYEKYELWQSKNCRNYMLLQILKFKQGLENSKKLQDFLRFLFQAGNAMVLEKYHTGILEWGVA